MNLSYIVSMYYKTTFSEKVAVAINSIYLNILH